MANVKWSDHAMACMKEQAKYIAEQSQSTETLVSLSQFDAHACYWMNPVWLN